MPIFEYCCESCGKEFEILAVNPGEQAACPQCGSENVKRLLSCFSANTSGDQPITSGGCAPKGGFS